MGTTGSLILLAALLPGQLPDSSLYVDFRGRSLPASFQRAGPDANSLVTTDSGGVRISVPADHPNRDTVGIQATFPVKGNFDIAAGYEIIKVDRPKSGTPIGVGLEFFIMTASREGLGLYRTVRPNGEEGISCSRNTTVAGKRQYKHSYFPATTTAGRLRMSRQGSEATCWVSEGAEGEYRELGRFDLGTEDLTMVRLAAFRGGTPTALDLRIVDLKIGTDAPIENLPQAQTSALQPGPKGSLVPLLIVALAIAGAIALSAGFYLWRRRQSQTESPGASAWTSFACNHCGKGLKTRADLAGRKVKCSQCGQPVPVPAAHDGTPATGPD